MKSNAQRITKTIYNAGFIVNRKDMQGMKFNSKMKVNYFGKPHYA
jgi:hypothetical protein